MKILLSIITKLAAIAILAIPLACQSKEVKNQYSRSEDHNPQVEEKYSLTADRKKFDEIRQQVPMDVRKENDELALILQLTQETKKNPSEIRSQFDKTLRKKRELFDKDMKKERETFSKNEKKQREEFLKNQTKERESFNKEKRSREERNEFYGEQDAKRKEYFANERERRADFESDFRDRRKNFEDYAKEKTNEFNQEHRAYVKRYEESKKLKTDSKKNNSISGPTEVRSFLEQIAPNSDEYQQLEREIEEIKARKGSPLGAGE